MNNLNTLNLNFKDASNLFAKDNKEIKRINEEIKFHEAQIAQAN